MTNSPNPTEARARLEFAVDHGVRTDAKDWWLKHTDDLRTLLDENERMRAERDALAALVEEAEGVIKKARNFHIKERADFDEANATLAKIASMKGKE